MSQDAAEKVIEASPDKKKRARSKGDVPISTEANTAAAMVGFLLATAFAGVSVVSFSGTLRSFFLRPEQVSTALLRGELGTEILQTTLMFILPLAGVPATLVILSLIVQQGIVFAPQRIKPELKKISPVDGFGKKFGPQALIEFLKNASKISLLTAVGGVLLAMEASRLAFLFSVDPVRLPTLLLRELLLFVSASLAISVVFALIDVPLVRAQREKRLRMSEQEARDEAKENDGDSQVKGQRRKRAERIAMSRMLSDVKSADVLIMNPTHFAVALKWERNGPHLPRCVAKGTDDLALRMRALAHDSGVPIRDDPITARALHAAIEVGDPIQPEHFAAVAAAIRFADRIRKMRR
ncbi:MAG: EscU/YscU/HrcU family type III secretion system export apparatus switch protein [Pseudomonadota bacterium]